MSLNVDPRRQLYVFLCVPIKHFTPLSPSRTSCFRGHLLHSNLSPLVTVPVTPFPHFGGLIPGLVSSDITWKHLHYVPLSVDFICLEDISCRISLKSPLFPLARIHSVLPVPMGEILQRGCASWRSVSELYPCQLSLEKLFNKCTREGFFLSTHESF